ncbi:unnamed protein product [Polarella glacialis]|uniref:Uncharacterized protein n=1 Tax=Polarella glacialis TaxID=89957 RepID=A0A813FC77_POLGL|nr:unnamed protein product [Polarella glacialis]
MAGPELGPVGEVSAIEAHTSGPSSSFGEQMFVPCSQELLVDEVTSLRRKLEKERQEFSEREDELIDHCHKLEAAIETIVGQLQESHAAVAAVKNAEVERLREENDLLNALVKQLTTERLDSVSEASRLVKQLSIERLD